MAKPEPRKPGRPKKKHGGGRPRKITDEVIRKLEAAFLLGCRDQEACFAANIGMSTLYDYCQANPDFSERKEALKKRPVHLARSVVIDALNNGDVASAHKVLDRADGSKVAVTGEGGGPVSLSWTIQPVAPKPDE